MRCPTVAEAEAASRFQLAHWWRFADSATTPEEEAGQECYQRRFKALHGFDPELSKRVGWDAPTYPGDIR